MWRSTRTFRALILSLLAVWPAGEVISDTVALRDGTKLEGIVGNRELLAGTPYAFERVTILIEETGEFRAVPVEDILSVLLVDGDAKRLIDVRGRPVEKGPTITDASGVPPVAGARDRGRDMLRLGFGASFPMSPSDFDRGWNVGWSGSVRLSFPLNPAASFNVGLEYNRFGIDGERFTQWGSGGSVDGGSVSVFYLPVEIQVRPPDVVRYIPAPYFVLGGGYYRLDVRDARVYLEGHQHTIPGGWEQAMGVHFGVGVTARRWFAEGLAVYGLTDYESTGHWAIRAGIQVYGSSF